MRHLRKSAKALDQLTPVIAQFIRRPEITETADEQTKRRDDALLTTRPRGANSLAIKFIMFTKKREP